MECGGGGARRGPPSCAAVSWTPDTKSVVGCNSRPVQSARLKPELERSRRMAQPPVPAGPPGSRCVPHSDSICFARDAMAHACSGICDGWRVILLTSLLLCRNMPPPLLTAARDNEGATRVSSLPDVHCISPHSRDSNVPLRRQAASRLPILCAALGESLWRQFPAASYASPGRCD